MAAVSVGTRPNEDYVVMDEKLNVTMAMGAGVGKGASKDKPRVPVRSAEAGTPSPGTGLTMIERIDIGV